MNSFDDWQRAYPEAAHALTQLFNGLQPKDIDSTLLGKSEAWAQQRARLQIADQGAKSWRNNVGVTPAKCDACGAKQQPVRYGLANDSPQMNKKIKSSDLILAIPRQITPSMVGQTIAQFGAIECKPPGWQYSGKRQEPGQMAWLTLINQIGGFGRFSTGDVKL